MISFRSERFLTHFRHRSGSFSVLESRDASQSSQDTNISGLLLYLLKLLLLVSDPTPESFLSTSAGFWKVAFSSINAPEYYKTNYK